VHMPVMDGLQATRRIKADPRGKATLILVLTASAMSDERRAVTQSGADGFLAKPCRDDELLEKIGALLDIAYDCEDVSGAEGQARDHWTDLSAPRAQLPLELVEELRHAISSGNKRSLDKLIPRVGEAADAGFARVLQNLANKYDYDALTRLLESA
jgi:CheY-like chemotaxis protein